MKKVAIAAGILLLVAGGYWYWQMPTTLESVRAVVQGQPTEIVAAVPGSVSEVYTRVGDMVTKGQPLLALNHSGYEDALVEEQTRLAELAASLPAEARVPSPLAPGVLRQEKTLATLRVEEEDARKNLDTAAQTYASASLALSRSQTPGTERQKTLIVRDEAGITLQKAKDAFEQASYARARREAQENKTAAGGGTISAGLAARIAEYQVQLLQVRQAERNLAATVVYAPASGQMLLVEVQPGREVVAGDRLVSLLSEDRMNHAATVKAVFTGKDAALLTPGQECGILVPGSVMRSTGRINSVLPPGGPEKEVTVQIDLDQNIDSLSVAPGEPVVVTVTFHK